MRRRLARLRSLSVAQWRVVASSVVLLPAVQISLRVRGFRRTASSLAARSKLPAVSTDPSQTRPLADAVGLVAGRSVIGARCLGRSLVLWFLLRRRGFDAVLVVGADMPLDGELFAHAWVEVAGEPVNDAPDVRERFGSFDLQLPRLAEARRQ